MDDRLLDWSTGVRFDHLARGVQASGRYVLEIITRFFRLPIAGKPLLLVGMAGITVPAIGSMLLARLVTDSLRFRPTMGERFALLLLGSDA